MNTKHKTPFLLISNDPNIGGKVAEYLTDLGMKYEFYQAFNLFEGFETLSKVPVELVLLDLSLPDSHGFKTLQRYLERVPNVPVVVVAASQNDIIGTQSVKAGAQDYLVLGQFDSNLFGRCVRFALQRGKVQLKLEETARELEYHKKRFLEVQQMAHFGTWEMDLVSNEMTWSDEVYRIFSFTKGSIVPTLSEYLGYVYPEDRAGVEDFFEMAGKSGQLHHIEHRILLEGFITRHVAVQAKLQVEDVGAKILLVGSIQDITERKTSEKLLIEKNISNQNARIQEAVLSDIGFQIRTPLSSIVNLLFLMENTEKSNQQTSYVTDLKTSVNDLSIAVNNLLNFSFMVSDQLKVEEEEFNLREFFKGVENVIRMKADASGQVLSCMLDPALPEKVAADPKKITQLLFNVIEYAIVQGNRGDMISLDLSLSDQLSNKFNLRMTVRTYGKKLPLSELAELRAAERLLEENPEGQKTAVKKHKLGIGIATKLAHTLGGSLQVKAGDPDGVAFNISIPSKFVRQTKLSLHNVPDGPIRILLVEDHFLNQIATKKVLTSWSDMVTVEIAENGFLGVEKYREGKHDLILMDIQMPVMNGIDAARQIREFSSVPIIALTANSTKQEQDKCLETGMNDYLAKPFKPEELYAKIMAALVVVLN